MRATVTQIYWCTDCKGVFSPLFDIDERGHLDTYYCKPHTTNLISLESSELCAHRVRYQRSAAARAIATSSANRLYPRGVRCKPSPSYSSFKNNGGGPPPKSSSAAIGS